MEIFYEAVESFGVLFMVKKILTTKCSTAELIFSRHCNVSIFFMREATSSPFSYWLLGELDHFWFQALSETFLKRLQYFLRGITGLESNCETIDIV